ncbi:MAG: hypothetical protein PUB22_00835 [Clostridiales bacterium]|nr:hypothetical protein [Clostridiales bacterium]
MYYLGARYYDPNIARFISADESALLLAGSDSIGNKNLYLYTENNPVGQKDEKGHVPIAFVGICALAGAVADVASVFLDDCIANKDKDQKTWSSWQTYVGATVGGAVGGVLRSSMGVYEFGDDMAITLISSTTASLVTQTLEKLTIPEKRDQSIGSIIGSSFKTGITDTIKSGAIGACTGGIFKGIKPIKSELLGKDWIRSRTGKCYGTRFRTWGTMGIRYFLRNISDSFCFSAARRLYNQARK